MSSSSSKRDRQRRLKPVNSKKRDEPATRDQILAAALKLVSENGYAGTSIAMICKEAGINASSLYWFFKNKEDLFLSTIKQAAEEFLDAVKIAPPQDADAGAWETNRDELMKSVSKRLEYNAEFLRLLLIVMLEQQNLPAELKVKIAEIRNGSLEWWKNLLGHVFSPLGTTTATILAADFAPLCRATINGAFIAQQHGEPIEIEHIMRQLTLLLSALIEKIAREK